VCTVGDVISVRENSRDLKVIKESLDSLATKVGWVEVDHEKLSGKFVREVDRKELPQDIVESQIVEYYNRKL
jgi:small subunit ribosomal protein S4